MFWILEHISPVHTCSAKTWQEQGLGISVLRYTLLLTRSSRPSQICFVLVDIVVYLFVCFCSDLLHSLHICGLNTSLGFARPQTLCCVRSEAVLIASLALLAPLASKHLYLNWIHALLCASVILSRAQAHFVANYQPIVPDSKILFSSPLFFAFLFFFLHKGMLW